MQVEGVKHPVILAGELPGCQASKNSLRKFSF
jgi:hypothetical protein